MKRLLLTATLVAISTQAMADDVGGMYAAGNIGTTSTRDAEFEDTGVTGDIEIDRALNFAGAIGTHVNPNVRAEVELSYRKAGLDSVDIAGVGAFDLTGDLKTTAVLANAYYDFTPSFVWSPYVSAGVGFARHSTDASDTVGGTVLDLEEKDTVFAYQLGFGVGYDVSEPATLTVGYRYLGSSDPEFDTLKAEYDAHEIRAGIRYRF